LDFFFHILAPFWEVTPADWIWNKEGLELKKLFRKPNKKIENNFTYIIQHYANFWHINHDLKLYYLCDGLVFLLYG